MIRLPGLRDAAAKTFLPLFLAVSLQTGTVAEQLPEYPLADFSLFKEPPLSSYPKQGLEAYRVFVIPTFASALCVRAERQGGKYSLVAKALGGKGGYEWSQIKKQSKRIISQAEWNQLLVRLSDASFWSMPESSPAAGTGTTGEEGSPRQACLDGTTLIVEGANSEKYRKVSRYCPSASFQSIGDYLLQLAGWKIGGV